MAYQAIGRGTSANDGTGDDLRSGAGKLNANFVELYTKFGDGTTLASNVNITGNAATATPLASSRNIAGVAFNGSAAISLASTNLSDTASICLAGNTLVLTGKTLTAPSINGGDGGLNFSNNHWTSINGTLINSCNTDCRSQRVMVHQLRVQIKLNCHANSHGQTIKPQPHSASVTNTSLLPAGASSTLVSKVSADVLTNKTLADLKTSVQTLSGAGAIDVVTGVTEVTTTAADALTLANGTVGQIKIIVMKADGGDGTITPVTFAGGTTITMNDVGDSVMLTYATTIGWVLVANNGCTIA